ncbi:hypothetical protein CANCADRAFT_132419 [Tortispora caseinolytica NRRL Y-17796]|uniref:Uncharacterized protein n=1 Tax=Tortispora caseinolytica NRRL Y-17796 TaxID=767744 RepID=A0A1E4TB81_9ASCO|nr:hypothetical protein CANCADRAFT_132419 [Tortispora caseinolytica NRRL Y-17796]
MLACSVASYMLYVDLSEEAVDLYNQIRCRGVLITDDHYRSSSAVVAKNTTYSRNQVWQTNALWTH